MSCASESSCPTVSLLKIFLLFFLAGLLLANSKEIARYIKISAM